MGETRKRVVGYVRVSSDSQIENTSIDVQSEKINDYCKLYNHELVEVFIDNGKTGSNTDGREGYNSMMDFISQSENRIDALIVLKADRIHRKLKNLLVMIEDYLQPNRVAFISITENFDTSTGQGMLFLQMIGSFAEFERKIINERTRSGRVKTAKNKQYAGGEPAYGYKAVNNALTVDEKSAQIVKKIFSMYCQGYSMNYIAATLNKTSVPTKNRRCLWARQTVSYILHNPVYAGVYTYHGKTEKNGIINKDQVPAIISKRLWNKVQKMMIPAGKQA